MCHVVIYFRNDDKFESVSQGPPESYVHTSGFLDATCDKYELDPSNLYNHSDSVSAYAFIHFVYFNIVFIEVTTALGKDAAGQNRVVIIISLVVTPFKKSF